MNTHGAPLTKSSRSETVAARAEARSVPPIIDTVLRGGGGRPLSPETRAPFETRFGFDFSRVRVHTDDRAVKSARALDAHAYTVGTDIVFNAGAFAPATRAGNRLLAHELTHVVQQSRQATPQILSAEDHGPLEAEADRAAERIDSQLDPLVSARDLGPGMGAPTTVAALPLATAHPSRLQRKTIGQMALGLLLPERQVQVVEDLLSSIRESPQHVGEFLTGEVLEAVRAHLPEIIAWTMGLIIAEDIIVVLGAAPTLISQIVAYILQLLVIAFLGFVAGVEAGNAYIAGAKWLALGQEANGDLRKITQASRQFVEMVWHIVMAILAVIGARAKIRSLPREAIPRASEVTAQEPLQHFTGTSRGDIVETTRLANNVGLSREMRVAEIVGGRVAKIGGKDLKLSRPLENGRIESARVDVIGRDGELIVVGGPAKGSTPGALSELGDRLRTLKDVATHHKVRAKAFFEEGTPPEALDLAKQRLGAENVETFPP